MIEKLLTPKDVAEILQLKESTVRGMLQEGILPYVPVGKQGGRRRVTRSALEQWIKSNEISDTREQEASSPTVPSRSSRIKPLAYPHLESLGFNKAK